MSEEIRSRNRGHVKARSPAAFDIVKELGRSLPNVEATTRYDGSPVLKVHSVFMAGLAMHFYRHYPLVLVRLLLLKREALRELLAGFYSRPLDQKWI